MIVYWLLLLVTAFFAYLFGCMDTMVLASNFVFHRNLRRLGDNKTWLSNFKRLYGPAGFLKLLAVELVKDLIPILIGSLLLGIRGHADAGRAFAGFVLVLGRLWPVLYRFKGSHASFALVVAAFGVQTSAGAAVLVVDDALLLRLLLMTAALVLIYHIPAVIRLFRGTEPRLSLEKDITYKLDQ